MSKEYESLPWGGIIFGMLIFGFLVIAVIRSPSPEQIEAKQKLENQKQEAIADLKLKDTVGMEDCTLHILGDVTVIRCPNSSTTVHYKCGKNCTQTNTTIDGDQQ